MFDKNTAILVGEIQEGGFTFSHISYDKAFYKATIAVSRLSDTIDYIPVVAPESIVKGLGKTTRRVKVRGKLSTYDTGVQEITPRILLYLLANSIKPLEDYTKEEGYNYVCLSGYLFGNPTYRRTPLGRRLTDLRIVVKKRGRGKFIFPCIAWGDSANYAYTHLKSGDKIKIEGRLQSREYFKRDPNDSERGEYKTTYEVSIHNLEKIT